MRRWCKGVFIGMALLAVGNPIAAQDEETGVWFDPGIDLVSQYIWRGQLYADAVTAQPYLYLGKGPLTFGAWSALALDGSWYELDLALAYALELPVGGLTFTLNDYYYKAEGFEAPYFEFGGVEDGEATGSHTLELVADYAGPESFPVLATLGWNIYNDPDNAAYGELGFAPTIRGFDVHGFVGAVLNDNAYYVMEDVVAEAGEVVNLGVTVSRWVPIKTFGVTVGASLIRNPLFDENWFVFALGF